MTNPEIEELATTLDALEKFVAKGKLRRYRKLSAELLACFE